MGLFSIKSKRKQEAQEFEYMQNMAELRVYSKLSQERPLTDTEYKRVMELKQKVNI
jgi:hypothetical protein